MNVLPAAHTIHRWLTRSSGALERNSGAATSAIAALVTTTSMARAEPPTLANLKAVGRPVTAETYQPTHPLACVCGRERARTGVSCVCRCAGGGDRSRPDRCHDRGAGTRARPGRAAVHPRG